VVERIEKPVVVQEKILPTERTEVQPVIHIDRDQLEVHQVMQPMRERDIAPTMVTHTQLPAEHIESRAPPVIIPEKKIVGETFTMPVMREQLERAPIVEETVHRKVLEEVQPVLYRETVRPTVVEATRPIYEHIVEAPVVCEEMRPVVDLGTKVIGAEQMLPATTIAREVPLQTAGIPFKETETYTKTTTVTTTEPFHHHEGERKHVI
jgi:hypothetical protein